MEMYFRSPMPSILERSEVGDAEVSYPIDTFEQQQEALARVGAVCQVMLELNDRIQGKQLCSGMTLEEVTELQDEFIGIADEIEQITMRIHEEHKITPEVRKADFEVASQIQLLLYHIISGVYVYGRMHQVDLPDWKIP